MQWQKDIDLKLREKEMRRKIQDLQLKLSYARVSVQKACFVLDAIRGKDVTDSTGYSRRTIPDMLPVL